MELATLQVIWFVLFFVLVIGYAVLDGFDLGVGAWSLFARDENERSLHMASIAPVWDGNEVWLLAAGGALFAAFPPVYATTFSGFYLAFMLLIVALIFRAVSFEFRSQVDSPGWRRCWDWAFGLGSLVPSILYGVAVGNIIRGLPVDARGEPVGTFMQLLNPYSLGLGLLVLVMFMAHGALYLSFKTEGDLSQRMRRRGIATWVAWVLLYTVMTAATFVEAPDRMSGLPGLPMFWLLLAAALFGLVAMPILAIRGRTFAAFLASSLAMASQTALAALGLFPILVPSRLDPAFDLTIRNSSATAPSLTVMFIIAILGMPMVIGYTAWAYRVFRGKVRHDEGYH